MVRYFIQSRKPDVFFVKRFRNPRLDLLPTRQPAGQERVDDKKKKIEMGKGLNKLIEKKANWVAFPMDINNKDMVSKFKVIVIFLYTQFQTISENLVE